MTRSTLLLSITAALALAGCDRSPTDTNAGTPGRTAHPGDNAGAPENGVAPAIGVAASDSFGRHLADARGRALYALESDTATASTCYDACERAWPPLLARGGDATLAQDAGLRGDALGRVTRTDGAVQLTYGGHPLYYYASDAQPRDVLGHGVRDNWGHWYLVAPDGSLVQTPSAAGNERAAGAAPDAAGGGEKPPRG